MPPTLQDFKADLFRALGHPTRIRILELLRGETSITVGELQQSLGIGAATTSQHLSVLRSHALVVARREGTSVWYGVRDPEIYLLLDAARALFEKQLHAQTQLLEDAGPGGSESALG
jgi:ArsR family transcriptional regulator